VQAEDSYFGAFGRRARGLRMRPMMRTRDSDQDGHQDIQEYGLGRVQVRRPRVAAPGRRPMVSKPARGPGSVSAIVDKPTWYSPPDWQIIADAFMGTNPPFIPPANMSMSEWQWRTVFNQSGTHVLLHAPLWVSMGHYMDFDVQPMDIVAKHVEGNKAVITLANGKRYRVNNANPPGWGL
jgi:hypothetical protein